MGSRLGATKVAAHRLGLTMDEYQKLLASGLKWCTACKEWHPREQFQRDRTRGDGLKASCLASCRGKPRGQRDPLKERARSVVSYAVRIGTLPSASAVSCTDCGHVWSEGERRHEYDHYKGYEPENHLAVQVVCTTCHADRERARRDANED